MYAPSSSGSVSRLRSNTRRMAERGVACGAIGGKSDWKVDVRRLSRCFGTFDAAVAPGVEKLFMTSSGGAVCVMPPPLIAPALGCFWDLIMSRHKEYCSMRKPSVGPRGVIPSRRLTFPLSFPREKSKKCDTPRGPAIVV